jgi:hypothetical protein
MQEQLVVEGERRMSNAQDEAVTADPAVIARIVAHDLVEKQIRNRG